MANNYTITLNANQLLYDIQTETRKAGFFQIDPNNPEALNEAQLGSESSDTDYIIRRCQQGVDSLLDILHKFVSGLTINGGSGSGADNAVMSNVTSWVITLSFDGRRNIYADGMASSAHRYVEYHALYNWAVMTMPSLANGYLEQMNVCELEILKMAYHKEPPTRPN